jgi:hypothetical protein
METGWQAWLATVGYIASHFSPDALLKIEAAPGEESPLAWSATISWGSTLERVLDCAALSAALDSLWGEVTRSHRIFETLEDAARSPAGYDDGEWFDLPTQDILHRLTWSLHNLFKGDEWRLVIVYHPTEVAELRVQTRVLAPVKGVQVGGRGASLLNATRDLFRNLAARYDDHSET